MEQDLNSYKSLISRYSREDLEAVKERMDKEKYPERYLAVLEEIGERERGGVLLTVRARSSFFGKTVPIGISVRIWWCFFWRFVLGSVVLVFFLGLLWDKLVFSFVRLSSVPSVVYVTSFFFMLVAFSIILTRQVLAKGYRSFDIFIRKKVTIQPASPPDRR